MITVKAASQIVEPTLDTSIPLRQPASPLSSPDPAWAESFRLLYVSLHRSSPVSIIGITSAVAGEGRSIMALGLAQTLAMDAKVLLVEADLDRPSLASRLEIDGGGGLAAVLRGETSMQTVTQRVGEHLFVVPAGASRGESSRLLRNLATDDAIRSQQADFGATIIDLPPMLCQGYAVYAASVADALILVIRASATPAAMVAQAIDRLSGLPLRGAILNGEGKHPGFMRRLRPHGIMTVDDRGEQEQRGLDDAIVIGRLDRFTADWTGSPPTGQVHRRQRTKQ